MAKESLIERRLPIDFLEPIDGADEVRQARVAAVRLINAFACGIATVLAQPNATVRDVAVRFWGQAYALGLLPCAGVTVTERSESLNISRAALSKEMVRFCDANGLTPSFYMKPESTHSAYREARIESIKRNGRNGSKPVAAAP